MKWGNPNILILLILVPIAFFLIGMTNRNRKKRFNRFAENRFYNFYLQEFSLFHWSLKKIIFIIGLMFIIIAAARPQWGREIQIVKKEGIDIVICLDVSKSMDAQDIQPSRMERAKDQISLFIDQLKGDRIALVAFAGKSFVQCPLTDDYGAAKLFLNLLDSESISIYGTDIGGALSTAYELFGEAEKHKVVIVVSDGEDLEENSIKTAEELAKKGAIIYTMGIGSENGSTIPISEPGGDVRYAKDDEGNIVFTKLDIDVLSQISDAARGRFYPITPQQSEIFEIMKNINFIEKKRFDSREYTRYKDRYRYFVVAGLLFLLIDIFIIPKKKVKLSRVIS